MGNIVQSFSYHTSESEMVEKAVKMAKEDGISFSELIVALLREEVRKKAVGSSNPIGVLYNDIYINKEPKKGSEQTDIRLFLRKHEIIKNAKELKADECETIAKNLFNVARFKRTGVIEV